MFSRQAILKYTFKSVGQVCNIVKVKNAAFIHSGCTRHLGPSMLASKHFNCYGRDRLISGLQLRHASVSSSAPSDIKSGNSGDMEPIPEPPPPLSELVQSTAEIKHFGRHLSTEEVITPTDDATYLDISAGPDIYRAAIEVFSSISQKEEYLGSRVSQRTKDSVVEVIESSDTIPEIYKTAVEIWKDVETSTSVSETHFPTNSFNKADATSAPASNFDEQHGNDLNLSDTQQLSTTNNSSIFDSLPDIPVVQQNLKSSISEAFTSEPSFSSMNLGGWSPVGMVQNGMEFLHIDCGLPWWGAVVCGTLFLRFLMFPVVIIGQRNAAKINNTLPQVQHFQAKITDARQRGDKMEAARHTSDMMKFMNEKNVNPLKNMIPPLCQAPVFISMFMGLRGLTNIPVESLKTGGMLWFVDLTVPDQFYLLPLVTSATLYCTLKVGADSGQPSQNMLLMKYFIMGLPVVMIPFTISFPGLILVYWTTSNFISLAQVGFLRIPTVRKYFKIEKLIRHEKATLPIKDKGFVNNIKNAWNNMKISSELEQRERIDRMAFLKAGRDPIKKTYKYNPTQVRPSSTTVQAKKR